MHCGTPSSDIFSADSSSVHVHNFSDVLCLRVHMQSNWKRFRAL